MPSIIVTLISSFSPAGVAFYGWDCKDDVQRFGPEALVLGGEPTVVATLGNFATKLLSGRQVGITKVHGQEQETTLGGRKVLLYPLYHPAAALYTPTMLKILEVDFARLPELLGRSLEPGSTILVARRNEEEVDITVVPPAPPEAIGVSATPDAPPEDLGGSTE